jgi:methylamine---corrinoid protein Co-methyltransferase
MIVSLAEIVTRSETGPFMKESDYDLKLAKLTAELVRRFGIKYDPQVIVPSDDGMADRLYQAGVELILEMGVYNQSTERVIFFTRKEIETAADQAPSSIVLGTGKDAVVMQHRPVEGEVPCVVHSGPTGTPCSERWHPQILYTCAKEPLVDCTGVGSVSTIHGLPVIPGSPLEIMASHRDAAVARDALRQAGRPGVHINDVPVPLTCAGKMATIDLEHGLRPSDGLLVTQLPELKTHYDQLSRAAHLQTIGMHSINLMTPLIGGLGGGAEGTAIVNIASHLMAVLCYKVSYHDMGHMSLRWSHNTGRMGLWIYALAGQALARNTPILTANAIYTRSGLGTQALLWEVAAGALTCAVSGVHQMGVGVTGGSEIDRTSAIEGRLNAEVAHAGLGLTRVAANEYILQFLEHYEASHADPDLGKPFSELHDHDTLEPAQEWVEAYQQVRESLIELGLDLDGGWRKVRKMQSAVASL